MFYTIDKRYQLVCVCLFVEIQTINNEHKTMASKSFEYMYPLALNTLTISLCVRTHTIAVRARDFPLNVGLETNVQHICAPFFLLNISSNTSD